MKNRFRSGMLFLIALGAVFPSTARPADLWTGVVVIADGRVEGNWQPGAAPQPEADAWTRWEQMEKMNGPGQLRGHAPPNAILMPDGFGRSVLAVAPHAGIEGYVVDAGAGMVDLRGAAVTRCMIRLSAGGQLMVKDALLSTFHVAESVGASPGGTIVIEDCAITGPFGGMFWGGTQRWVVRGCHFRESQLPWVALRPGQVPVVERCHFEKCFIPESFLMRCRDCTFDGCIIGSPESFAGGGGKAMVLTETGSVSQWLGRPAGAPAGVVVKGEARSPFWSGWRQEQGENGLDCRMASGRVVVPLLLSQGAEHAAEPGPAAGWKGKVYRRMDGAERLQFEETAIKVIEVGEVTGAGTIQSRAGRKVEWTQTVRAFDTENGFGGTIQAGGSVSRKGWFSPDYSLLAVIDEVPGSAPDPVRIFRTLAEDTPTLREPVGQVVGTTWSLAGPDKRLVRFETPTQLIWFNETAPARGGSLWRPLQADHQLVIAWWQDGPAEVNLEAGLRSLRIVDQAGKAWQGTLVGRDQPGDFRPLLPRVGAPAVAAAGMAETAPGTPQENPFAPGAPKPTEDKAPPAATATLDALKSRTSRVNGLLVAELDGGKTAGATSQMNVVAVPSGAGGETTLAFNQKIGPMMEQALLEVRKFQTIRQGKWPEGFRIEISFADKYTPKDGPSAAVACALLLEGLFTGAAWDSSLAVTGDLNADGSVQPVGGVPAKIRGAVGRKCRIVGIPQANERAVRDYFLSEGPQSLLAIHVFTIKEFDEARDLAQVVKPPDLTTALTEFDRVIQLAPAKEKAGPWLKQAAVAAQLRKVTKAAPHHLSAKLLLEYAEGRAPVILSLTGSLEAIDRESFEVLQAIRSSKDSTNFSGIRPDKLGDAIYRLRRLRGSLHPETRPLLDSMETFSVMIRSFLANPPRTPAFLNKAVTGIRAAGGTVDRQYQALRNNPEVMAELMKE